MRKDSSKCRTWAKYSGTTASHAGRSGRRRMQQHICGKAQARPEGSRRCRQVPCDGHFVAQGSRHGREVPHRATEPKTQPLQLGGELLCAALLASAEALAAGRSRRAGAAAAGAAEMPASQPALPRLRERLQKVSVLGWRINNNFNSGSKRYVRPRANGFKQSADSAQSNYSRPSRGQGQGQVQGQGQGQGPGAGAGQGAGGRGRGIIRQVQGDQKSIEPNEKFLLSQR